MRDKLLVNLESFFVIVLYRTKRRCSQLKVEIEDGREAA